MDWRVLVQPAIRKGHAEMGEEGKDARHEGRSDNGDAHTRTHQYGVVA
jgi:hypothetical protein